MAGNTSKPPGSPADPAHEFLALADILPEILLLVTAAGDVRAANRAAAAELDQRAADLAGRRLMELCPSQDAREIQEYLRHCTATRHALPGSLTFGPPGASTQYRVDGAAFQPHAASQEALVVLRCVRKEHSVSRFVLLNRKVEELGEAMNRRLRVEREREELLQREQAARRAAEAASRMKDDFLATLSHELRTPLNAIVGWTRILQLGAVDEEGRTRAFEAIERNVKAQTQLVHDLLDVSRIVAGHLRIDRSPVPLARVIEAALDSVRPAAENKRIRLAAALDHRPLVVSGDEGRLQQVIWNLLSNAVKFTPQHGIVSVRLDRLQAQARVVVSDSGRGFGADDEPFLFQRFWQADQSSSRVHGGLGLGLAIVRELVEAHGGTVEAHSAGEGHGATFTVLLPVAAEEEAAAVLSQDPGSTVLNGIEVLLVDDDGDGGALVTAQLEAAGARVTTVDSTAAAVEAIRARAHDVLLADLRVPERDALTLIGEVRRLDAERSRHTPAIAITAAAHGSDPRDAFAAGYDTHITRPVDVRRLTAVLQSIWRA